MALVLLVSVVVLLALAIDLSLGRHASASNSAAYDVMVVTALPGDSLWSLGRAHQGDMSIRGFVDVLIELNGGPTIEAGQRVKIPVWAD